MIKKILNLIFSALFVVSIIHLITISLYPDDNLINYPRWLINQHELQSEADWLTFEQSCPGAFYLHTDSETFVRCKPTALPMHNHVFKNDQLEKYSTISPSMIRQLLQE